MFEQGRRLIGKVLVTTQLLHSYHYLRLDWQLHHRARAQAVPCHFFEVREYPHSTPPVGRPRWPVYICYFLLVTCGHYAHNQEAAWRALIVDQVPNENEIMDLRKQRKGGCVNYLTWHIIRFWLNPQWDDSLSKRAIILALASLV